MKKIFFIILLLLALASFYKINSLNYEKSTQIKKNTVEHPETLPSKEFAQNSSFGFSNVKSDYYWLQTVQYIGGNAVSSEYKKYLYAILDIVTQLAPGYEQPYVIGELLLPSNDENDNFAEIHTLQAEKIGLKGIDKFCRATYVDENGESHLKIDLIKDEYNLNTLWSEEKYKNPCESFKIPYNLAFVYYYYLNKPKIASYYFKVASAQEVSLDGAKIMTAIMQGKGGDREKSFFMFLNMAASVEQSDEVCTGFSNELNKLALGGKLKNDTFTIKTIEENRNRLFPEDIDELDQKLDNTRCLNFLNKAVRELNLSYIQNGDNAYFTDKGEHSKNAKILYDEGYIDFLPTDAQQSEDHGVIYIYNEELGNYDYQNGRY